MNVEQGPGENTWQNFDLVFSTSNAELSFCCRPIMQCQIMSFPLNNIFKVGIQSQL